MSDPPVLYIVIPLYNESANVPNLVAALNRLADTVDDFDVFLVFSDDGSTDDTTAAVEQSEIIPRYQLIRNQVNGGPGAAVGAAFSFLQEPLRDSDWIMTMEGDNTSDPETLRRMLTRRKEGYEMVMASVYSYGGGFHQVQWHRLFLSYVANEIVKCKLRIYGIHTLSSFFRLYSAPLFQRLYRSYDDKIVEMNGFGWAVEMLYKCIQVKATISEIETTVDWSKRECKSKMRIVRTGREYLRILCGHSRWRRTSHT